MPSSISQQQQQSSTPPTDIDSSSDIPVMLPVLPLSKRVHFLLHGDEVVKTGTVTPASEHVAVSNNDINSNAAAPPLTKAVVRGMYVCMYVCACYQMKRHEHYRLIHIFIHVIHDVIADSSS
jgi:hypothetical protein